MGPARKFYSLNADGEATLATFWQNWEFLEKQMTQLKGDYHV